MNLRTLPLAAVAMAAVTMIAAPAVASTTIFGDRATFVAAAGPLTTETFESCQALGRAQSLSAGSPGPCGGIVPGIKFSPDTDLEEMFIVPPGHSTNPTTALGLVNPRSGELIIDFTSAIFSFGADLFQNRAGGSQGPTSAPFTLSAFGANGLIGRFDFGVAPNGGSFFGLTSTDAITQIRVSQIDGFAEVDNTSFGGPAAAVPEPATWAMMVLSFAGMGAALRRRARSSIFA